MINRNTNLVLIIILFIISIISTIYEIPFIYRESILITVLLIEAILHISNNTKISLALFVFIAISISSSILGYTGNYYDLFITVRSVALYPLLIFVGCDYFENDVDISIIVKLYLTIACIVAFFATIEFLIPSLFQGMIGVLGINYNKTMLLRSGLGYGIGSIFVSKTYLGCYLCLAIVFSLNINKYSYKVRDVAKWGLSLWFYVLIGLTFSRTSLFTATLIMIYNIYKSVNKRNFIRIITVLSFLTLGSYSIPMVRASIASISNSLNAIDGTLSGRTEIWSQYFGNEISILPNMHVLGNTSYSSFTGIADSTYIRFLAAYGIVLFIILSFIVVSRLMIIRSHKGDKRLFVSLFLYVAVMSIAIDLSFIFMICVPTYLCLGYEYKRIIRTKSQDNM